MGSEQYSASIYRDGDQLTVASGAEIEVESGGTIDVESGGYFKLAGTAVTATAAEINELDLSANTEAITAAGEISITKTLTTITGPATSTYAVTLAAPTKAGIHKIITMTATTDTNAVTLALTNCTGGTAASSASFNAAAETLILLSVPVSASAFKWAVLKEIGVTLS